MTTDSGKHHSLRCAKTPPTVWLALGCILMCGLLIRALYLRELTEHPDFGRPAVDAGFHDYWARAMATGHWTPPEGLRDPGIRSNPFLRPPGYPYFLAMVYRFVGPGYTAPRIVQLGLGLLGGLLGFFFAKKWYGDLTALVLVALLNAYWVLIYFEAELHAPVLVILLLWAVVIFTAKWTERLSLLRAGGVGVLLGVAALIRPNVLLLAPAIFLWTCWICRRRRWKRKGLPIAAGLLAGLCVVIAPVTLRNYRVSGDFVLISSNAGINLFIGNNPMAHGGVMSEIPELGKFGTCYDYPALVENLEQQEGRSFSASQVSAYFAAEAWRWIRRHPMDFLRITAWKSALFWGPKEVEHNKIIRAERTHTAVLRNLPVNFWFVLGTALMGLVLLIRDRRGPATPQDSLPNDGMPNPAQQRWEVTVLLVVMVLTFFFSIVPFFIAARYRVPIIPFLLLLAADGLCRVVRMARVPALRSTAGAAGVWILISAIAGRPAPLSRTERTIWHLHRGLTYERMLAFDSAAEEFQSAVRASPNNVDARFHYAYALAKRGQFDEAARQLRAVLRLDPNHAEARQQLKVLEGHPNEAS